MSKPEHAGFGNKTIVQPTPKPDPGGKPHGSDSEARLAWVSAYKDYIANLPQAKYS